MLYALTFLCLGPLTATGDYIDTGRTCSTSFQMTRYDNLFVYTTPAACGQMADEMRVHPGAYGIYDPNIQVECVGTDRITVNR